MIYKEFAMRPRMKETEQLEDGGRTLYECACIPYYGIVPVYRTTVSSTTKSMSRMSEVVTPQLINMAIVANSIKHPYRQARRAELQTLLLLRSIIGKMGKG